MSTIHKVERTVVCPSCDAIVDHISKSADIMEIRGVSVPVTRVCRVCTACGAEFENTHDHDWRADGYAAFRERAGYVTPEQMKAWRIRNGLTQAEVGELLGFGEATLGRYEKGSLQTAANNVALARVMTPHGLIDAINERPDAISAEKRKRIIAENSDCAAENAARTLVLSKIKVDASDDLTGNRVLSYDRLVSFVRRLSEGGRNKTVLNKLMFYCDFLAFRENGNSISGLCYARLPYGPVPENYYALFGVLSAVDLIKVTPQPLDDGRIAELISPSARAFVSFDFGKDEAIIRHVCKYFDGYTSSRISNYSHKERAWIDTPPASLISYKYATYLQI